MQNLRGGQNIWIHFPGSTSESDVHSTSFYFKCRFFESSTTLPNVFIYLTLLGKIQPVSGTNLIRSAIYAWCATLVWTEECRHSNRVAPRQESYL